MIIAANFRAPASRPHAEWRYFYQSAGDTCQSAKFKIYNTGLAALGIVTRVEASLTGAEVRVPGQLPAGGSSNVVENCWSVRIAAEQLDANGQPMDGAGSIRLINASSVVDTGDYIPLPNLPGFDWPAIYNNDGTRPFGNECVLIENTGREDINIGVRVEPAHGGREVHVDPTIKPNSCMFIGSVYSIRVAANQNATQPASLTWKLISL